MFAELNITSNFTFLTGASHPEEYMERAALLGLPGIAVADENSVAGIVRAHTAARNIARKAKARREAPLIGPPRPDHCPAPVSADILNAPRLIPAARMVMRDGFTVTMLPRDRTAWGRLCRLISKGRLRAEKGRCDLGLGDLIEWGAGSEMLIHPPGLTGSSPRAGGDFVKNGTRFGHAKDRADERRKDGGDVDRHEVSGGDRQSRVSCGAELGS